MSIDDVMFGLAGERVSVGPFLCDAVQHAESAARRCAVNVRCAWQPGISIVLIDGPRMQRMVATLVVRAIERTARGGEVLVTAELYGDEVRICIADSGPDDDDEPRPEADESKDEARWSAISRALALHGGRIWREDDDDSGSACFVSLLSVPRAKA